LSTNDFRKLRATRMNNKRRLPEVSIADNL